MYIHALNKNQVAEVVAPADVLGVSSSITLALSSPYSSLDMDCFLGCCLLLLLLSLLLLQQLQRELHWGML